ncbi:MAG TPA: sigma 54-interacting transcriptional regulator [Candidatus Polarisedimenticolia bacterium]|nr:sigma 54-interacting transcriptional regulator [Candidatus Polarisedimenticolia bacterium]
MGSWSGEEKYRAILAVSNAANEHLDLSSLLEAVAVALEDLVSIDVIGVIGREGGSAKGISGHLRANPRRRDESEKGYMDRVLESGERRLVTREMLQAIEVLERDRTPVIVDDVQKESRLPVQGAVHLGIRSMVLLPLATRARFVGMLAVSRLELRPFSADEVRILEDISRPVGIAVANAFAHEEVRRLRALLEAQNLALQEEIQTGAATGGIIGSSAALRGALERVARVAATDATVLITGETGTGKELIARAIHAASPRARHPLIKVNCAVLPEGLVASELFGHERGAFTGAVERRRGRFELAARGTIFLDEIGELPPATQVALLRVLQEGEFERVGGHETLRTEARVVAATNRNLDEAVAAGKFRSDLLFRLNVFPITAPPLRDRTEDIPIIAEYYVSHYARKLGKRVRGIDPGAVAMLTAYPWPGNVRELQNIVERAVIMAGGEVLGEAEFELPGRKAATAPAPEPSERRQIEEALRASRGRVSGIDGAAQALGMAPSTLESRIQRLGIDKHAFRRRTSD